MPLPHCQVPRLVPELPVFSSFHIFIWFYLLFQYKFIILPLEIEYDIIMDATNNVKKWTREDFLALLERGRQIKARR